MHEAEVARIIALDAKVKLINGLIGQDLISKVRAKQHEIEVKIQAEKIMSLLRQDLQDRVDQEQKRLDAIHREA